MDRLLRARVLLAEAETLGVTLDDLIAVAAANPSGAARPTAAVPTVSDYLAVIRPTFTKGTRQTYDTYWRLAEELHGRRPIDQISVDDLEALVVEAGRRAQVRRPSSTGRSSRENCVAALRALFKRAKRARLIPEDPAAEIVKPRRQPGRRRALTEPELTEAVEAIRMCSTDLDLDSLLTEFHLETGARREGALNLAVQDADRRRSTVWLREMFSMEREQPISPSLLARILALAEQRDGTHGTDKVFRSARGKPITRRHYCTLFGNVQAALPWPVLTPVTPHVLRHMAAKSVERLAGRSVAEAFLGHAPATTSDIYTQATIEEVAAALAHVTGEPHPLVVLPISNARHH
jgi:integrase/recombinase XerC